MNHPSPPGPERPGGDHFARPADPDFSGNATRSRTTFRRLLAVLIGVAALLLGSLIGLLLIKDDGGPVDTANKSVGASGEKAPDSSPGAGAPAPNTAAPSSEASAGAPRTEDESAARAIAQRAMNALNKRDVQLAKQISCEPGSVRDDALEDIPDGTEYALKDEVRVGGDQAVVPFTIVYQGQKREDEVHLERERTGWCVVG